MIFLDFEKMGEKFSAQTTSALKRRKNTVAFMSVQEEKEEEKERKQREVTGQTRIS
jgi:hypothetical protein